MVAMGNCINRQEPEPTSEALIIRDLREVITRLSLELSYRERDLRMVRGQVDAFLQEIENKDREVRVNEMRLLHSRMTFLKQKRVRFPS